MEMEQDWLPGRLAVSQSLLEISSRFYGAGQVGNVVKV